MLCVLLGMVLTLPLFAGPRSFDSLFPGLNEKVRSAVFSGEGYIKASERSDGFKLIGADAGQESPLDRDITGDILAKRPGFIVETLLVIPGGSKAVSLLDVYNALGRIRDLKGRLYRSHSRNENIPLFEEATRLASEKKNTPIADPPLASAIPSSETVFIRLKDVNFGNSYYRGNLRLMEYGLRYSLTNNKNLNYLFIPVIKEEKFTAQFYFEQVQEGILIYSIAGADVSDFVSSKIDMASAIGKRLAVILSWVTDGIAKTGQ
ncbi:MAG: hypothetical protein LBD48_06520 [Treponema sp.]|nr:hypothetical protein [Treponema sp.]